MMQTETSYPRVWRLLHWVIAMMVLCLLPVGWWMATRGAANIWDNLTNTLYAWHKAIGFTVLWLMCLRIAIKLRKTTPPYPPGISPIIKLIATTVHVLMYALLVLIPLLGWAGVTAYPALITVGGLNLPALPLIPQGEALAKRLFEMHGLLALALGILIFVHIAAAFKHLLINRDTIFSRMWPVRHNAQSTPHQHSEPHR